jgi:hypothetical protein
MIIVSTNESISKIKASITKIDCITDANWFVVLLTFKDYDGKDLFRLSTSVKEGPLLEQLKSFTSQKLVK